MPLLGIAEQLRHDVGELSFGEPIACVYNPLVYAWELHSAFLKRFGTGLGRVLLLGMNPGPWGMAQTGVPFGEVAFVRDWMGLVGKVESPQPEHPKRPVEGLACSRSEVSGARLWGWAKERFGPAESFFERFFVVNYCPLVFMERSGKNRTPDKLPATEREPLIEACDKALLRTVCYLRPSLVVGVGVYAQKQAERALVGQGVQIGRILHPSPASPTANRGWAAQAEAQLRGLGCLEARM